MATFLDINVAADVALLHSSVQSHDQLSVVVDRSERDILNHYTVSTGVNTFEVSLEGYDDTTPASSHATLKTALKYAVAEVASHRLRLYDATPQYQSESIGDYSYDRGVGSGTLDTKYPVGWAAELDKWYRETDRWYTI